jgi:hypothetical protein
LFFQLTGVYSLNETFSVNKRVVNITNQIIPAIIIAAVIIVAVVIIIPASMGGVW